MRLMWRKKEEGSINYPRSPEDSDVSWAMKNAIASYYSEDSNETDEEETELSPIVRLANTLLHLGLKENASDIHFEPDRRNLRMRARIDGVLYEKAVVPKYIEEPLTARYREMAGMSSEPAQTPQLGSLSIKFDGANYILRVNSLPTQYGEKIVLHICKQFAKDSSALLGLSKLGMTPEMQTGFEETLVQSGGLIIFAGHTGSGKTTTQFNVLSRMNSIEQMCFVIGEHLEYELGGVACVKVNPKAGLTYEEAIEAVRYESPSVVMLDQISDVNVWRAALNLAHSGTIVLAATCAQDTAAALIRLRDLGIAPSVLASSVSGVLAQRLVRRVCPHCMRMEMADEKDWRGLGLKQQIPAKPIELAHAVGCEKCRNTGYSGRVGVFEFLHKSYGSVEALLSCDGLHLRSKLLEKRWKTFADDLVVKLTSHVTTPEEVYRVFGITLYGDGLVGV